MSAPLESLAELLPAVMRRETEALDRWYRAEHPEAYRLCLGFLADSNEAEDAAQDAMLQILDQLHRFDSRRDYGAWRTSVVLNLCRDRQRRSQARKRAETRAATSILHNLDQDSSIGTGRYVSRPDSRAERDENQQLLTRCLAQLTPREREVFVLRDLSQHSCQRVAALLDIGESSVRSLLALARRHMRNLLAPQLGDADQRLEGPHV